MSDLFDREKEKQDDAKSSSQDFLPLEFADKQPVTKKPVFQGGSPVKKITKDTETQVPAPEKKPIPLSAVKSSGELASAPERKVIPLTAMKKKSPPPLAEAPVMPAAPAASAPEPPEAHPIPPPIPKKDDSIIVMAPPTPPSASEEPPVPAPEKKVIKLRPAEPAVPSEPAPPIAQEKKAIKLKPSETAGPSGESSEDFNEKMKRIFDDELLQKKNAEAAAAKASQEAAREKESAKKEKAAAAASAEPTSSEEPKSQHPLISGRHPVKRKTVRNISSIASGNASVGQILQEARASAGLSIGQVEQLTKIKVQYLEAIERDDHKRLPPMVYVNAYIKTLCFFYGIDPAETQALLSNLKEETDKHTVSGEIIAKLEDEKQVNYEEELKVKRILVYSSIVVGTLLLTGATIGVAFFSSSFKKKDGVQNATVPVQQRGAASVSFTSSELEKFVPNSQLNMTDLFSGKK